MPQVTTFDVRESQEQERQREITALLEAGHWIVEWKSNLPERVQRYGVWGLRIDRSYLRLKPEDAVAKILDAATQPKKELDKPEMTTDIQSLKANEEYCSSCQQPKRKKQRCLHCKPESTRKPLRQLVPRGTPITGNVAPETLETVMREYLAIDQRKEYLRTRIKELA